jgi:hypothetical protein
VDHDQREVRLPDEIKDRIRLEEQYRVKLRAEKEQEVQGKTRSIVAFFSTALGIAVLTSVLVPAMGGLYSHIQQKAAQRTASNQQVVRLTAEFDWRLAEIEYHRGRIPALANADKWASAAYIWRAIIGDPGFVPTDPSFKNVHLAGIVSQLKSLGYPDPDDIAFKTIKKWRAEEQKSLCQESHSIKTLHMIPHFWKSNFCCCVISDRKSP